MMMIVLKERKKKQHVGIDFSETRTKLTYKSSVVATEQRKKYANINKYT